MFVGVQFAVRTYICFHANTARVCVRARACVQAVRSLVKPCSSFRCLHC